MAFGTPGGDQQDQWQTIFFLRHVHHRMNLQEAIDAPRFHHQWLPDSIRMEKVGFSPDTLKLLSDRGHKLDFTGYWSDGLIKVGAEIIESSFDKAATKDLTKNEKGLKAVWTGMQSAYFDAPNGVAPEVVFDAAAELLFVVGVDSARYDDGLRWGRMAEVALVDVPDDEHLREASLLAYLADKNALHEAYINAHTAGFDAALALAQAEAGSINKVAAACDLDTDDVARFYAWFATTARSLTIYSQGINQSAHGTDKVNTWVDITDTLDLKIKALQQHASQVDPNEVEKWMHEWAEEEAKGQEMKYAEA